MALSIAEYLGQRVDGTNEIQPAVGNENCPFMAAPCSKIKELNKPICSVRKNNGDIWIVCKHRLCATLKNVPLVFHQRRVLISIAKRIWGNNVEPHDIFVKREVRIPVVGTSNYNADYIMINRSERLYDCPKKIVLEMQGGGETSNTGRITNLVNLWENNPFRTNADLASPLSGVGTIETNAWRRQQEQFIIKGNIAMQTGGAIVFCVGKTLYDYLYQRVQSANLRNLENNNWTLCLIGFTPDEDNQDQQSLNFHIDNSRILFTNYISFVQTLINQGDPYPEMFLGEFDNLANTDRITIL